MDRLDKEREKRGADGGRRKTTTTLTAITAITAITADFTMALALASQNNPNSDDTVVHDGCACVCVCDCVPVMCSVFECVKVSHWLWLVDNEGVGVATTYTSPKGEADSDQSYRTTQQPLRARRNQDHNQQGDYSLCSLIKHIALQTPHQPCLFLINNHK